MTKQTSCKKTSLFHFTGQQSASIIFTRFEPCAILILLDWVAVFEPSMIIFKHSFGLKDVLEFSIA